MVNGKILKKEIFHVNFNFFTIHHCFASYILPQFLYKTEGKVPNLFYFLINNEITFPAGFVNESRGIVNQLINNESMPYVHNATTPKIFPIYKSTRNYLYPIRTRTPPIDILDVIL